jgi:hypothetical protein
MMAARRRLLMATGIFLGAHVGAFVVSREPVRQP